MLEGWKGIFGAKTKGQPKAPAAPKMRRVNLDRRFTIVSQFSQGSMSRVYRAVDNTSGRTICLKVQHREKTEAAVARSVRAERPSEGEIATQIVHPHVVRTFEYGETTKGEYYLVMEFVDGVSLQYLRESKGLTYARKLEVLKQAAEGLAEVHAKGFIHHDFGPKNVLVNREGDLKLIDFGLAVPNTPAFRKPGNRTGTLHYMAPELIRRETTDERIDIFSYGVTAYELFTDRLPYDATNSMAMMLQRINSDPLDPARANPDLPPELCDVLRKAIARRKEDRYPSMTKLLEDLEALPAEEPRTRRR